MARDAICKYCKKDFIVTDYRGRLFCSNKCYRKSRPFIKPTPNAEEEKNKKRH